MKDKITFTKLQWDEQRECVVCPTCGEALRLVEEIGHYDPCSVNGEPGEPQWKVDGYLYACDECGSEFISREEI